MKFLDYHNTTKHYPGRFAKSLGYLDWESQPSMFKEYFNSEKISLTPFKLELNYENLYLNNKMQDININTIATFLKNSAAINAKKVYREYEYYVKVNPSSGNLHPEEVYIIFKDSLFHFNSKSFKLELLSKSKHLLIEDGFIVIFNSIPLREAWKYGERALRYCLLDTGHLIGSSRYSANLLGWNMKYIDIDFSNFFKNFKFYENEEEFFEVAFVVYKDSFFINKDEILNLDVDSSYYPLARKSVRWDIVYDTFDNLKIYNSYKNYIQKGINFLPSDFLVEEIIHNRRSALGYKKEAIPKELFFDILDKTLPRNIVPFDVDLFLNKVDFLIFVNRVDGIESGVYYFNRSFRKVKYSHLQEELFLIDKGDYSSAAKFINCMQDIGSDSAFTINMVIDKSFIKDGGDYKLAMFEAGLIGQILYLEAEAKGIRGCGIGCFFDDLVSIDFLGDEDLIALYGFSVGVPLVDERVVKIF